VGFALLVDGAWSDEGHLASEQDDVAKSLAEVLLFCHPIAASLTRARFPGTLLFKIWFAELCGPESALVMHC